MLPEPCWCCHPSPREPGGVARCASSGNDVMAIRQELAELLSESFDVNAPEYTSVAASALEQSLPVQSERVDGAPAVDGERLADLLRAAAAKRDAKARELALKDETVDRALYDARTTYLRLRERADELLRQHERTTNELVAHKATLERSEHDDASGVPTLKEALKVLTKRQSELESAADWFAVAAHAESLWCAPHTCPMSEPADTELQLCYSRSSWRAKTRQCLWMLRRARALHRMGSVESRYALAHGTPRPHGCIGLGRHGRVSLKVRFCVLRQPSPLA